MRATLSREYLDLLRSLDDSFTGIHAKLDLIIHQNTKEKQFMEASQDVLLDAFNQLDSSVDDLVASEAAGAAEIAELAEVIKNLPPGTALTADQIQTLAFQASSAAQAMRDAVSAAQTQPPETTPPDQGTDTPPDEPQGSESTTDPNQPPVGGTPAPDLNPPQ